MVVGGGGGFWTTSLRAQPSSAIQKTPGVFKMMHPGRLVMQGITYNTSGGGGDSSEWHTVFSAQPIPRG